MDRLQAMRIFVAVVEAQGFAGAARKLRLSPPAVTRAVNDLEGHLGVRLLTRTTRVVRLTDAGTRHADDCRRILAELDEADASLAGMHSAPRGRLVVTAPVLFGAHIVTPIVTDYLQRYPEMQASCLFLDRVVNLVDEGVDVAVRIGELPDSSLQAVRVGQVRRVICASPAYLARHGTPSTPDALANHCSIDAQSAVHAPAWTLYQDGVPQTVKLQPRMLTSTNDSAVAAAVGGFGLTQLLSYQVAEQVQAGRLQTVLNGYEPPALPVHVVHREGRHAAQRVRAFLDLAIDMLRANTALQ